MSENDEDILLIRKIGKGNEHALVSLMERYKEPIFRFAFRYLANEADCAEVAEDTFFRVFQKASAYTPRATVKTWLFSIALNLCRDRLRRQKKLRGRVSLNMPVGAGDRENNLLESIDSGSPDPHCLVSSSESLRLVNNTIQNLPEKLKFPFIFCVLEDHSYDECAAVLKTNRKTVETRIYRARHVLKTQLADFFEKI